MSKNRMILVSADDLLGMGYGNRPVAKSDGFDIKTYKRIKKLLKEEEDEKKKNAPKKDEAVFMKDWSLGGKICFFALAGPPLGVGYIFGLILAIRGLAAFVVGVH